MDTGDRLLTPGEVASLFRVDPKTISRWAQAGRISRVRTPGGHGRYRESEVRRLLEGNGAEDDANAFIEGAAANAGQARAPMPAGRSATTD
jgi:excisionase family DNA binding protein